jgi:hypothetical protein
MLKRVLRDAFPAGGSPLLSHCSTFSAHFPNKHTPASPLNCF